MPDFTIYKISDGTRFRVHGTFDNQQHLRTDTHHTAAVEFNRQNQNKGSLDGGGGLFSVPV